MEACKARSPYTLLGFLLSGEDVQSASSACFSLRDYFARGTNFLLWIALISITFLLCRNLSRLLTLWAHGSRIPGPPSPSFFSGHSSLIAACISARDLTGYLSELHEKYGPIVRLWLGPTQLLVSVKDVEVIKEILINAKDKLPLTGRVFHLAFGRSNVFVSSFEKVQEGREYLAVCMNERLLDKINTIPLKVVDCVLGRVESIMSKGTLDCRSISRHISFHILGGTLFEEGFLNWSDATLYEELLLMVFKDACFWASYKVPPFWRREYWRYQYLCTKLKRLTQDIIQHSISTLPDQSTYKEREITGLQARNCTSVSFANMASGYGFLQEEKRRHLISSEQSFGDILGMMFHGCQTFSNLVCSILTRLVLHPELQMKIFSEIKEVQLRTFKPDSYDVQEMHFLMATVYESARLSPPGPLLQRCSLNHDLHLKSSITVPSGAILAIPLQLVHMDNSVWGDDACQFNPHRFVSNSVKKEGVSKGCWFVEPDKNAVYLPFGAGSRECIGQKFAILGISTLFAYLLKNYEIRLVHSSENDLNSDVNDHVQMGLSPKIVFVKRSN